MATYRLWEPNGGLPRLGSGTPEFPILRGLFQYPRRMFSGAMGPEGILEEYLTQVPNDFPGKAPTRECNTSFGGDGTTISVNAYGHILQISRFFGYGRSGFFCADGAQLSQPYYVQERMEQLMKASTDAEAGIRLDLDHAFDNKYDLKLCTSSMAFLNDRWPRFTFKLSRKSSFPSATIQYFSYRGTVFQEYCWDVAGEGIPDRLKISIPVRIQTLDFVKSSTWNEEKTCSPQLSPDRRSLLLVQHISSQDANDMGIISEDSPQGSTPKAAALIISPYVDGEVQEVMMSRDESDVSRDKPHAFVKLSFKAKESFRKESMICITLCYRLQLLQQEPNEEAISVPASHFENHRREISHAPVVPFRRLRFSRNEHLDFTIRRNLEHILSVCSVPVPDSPFLGHPDDSSGTFSLRGGRCTPIALTCGDISGHRVASRASYYAFKFLLSMSKYFDLGKDKSRRWFLPDQSKCLCEGDNKRCEACEDINSYVDHLHSRIQYAIRGHVNWVCTKAKKFEGFEDDRVADSTKHKIGRGMFSPHYWSTGECITDWAYLPPQSLADTPLQLLKISEFVSENDENKDYYSREGFDNGLYEKIRPWISDLDKTNKCGRYCFSKHFHPTEFSPYWQIFHDMGIFETDAEKYRLADHILICLAIRFVENDDVLKNGLEVTEGESLSHAEKPGDNYVLNRYTYKEVRRNVLKRFTVEGPLSKQRMLATCRTPEESRFLFHSKDTILLHMMQSEFFQDERRTPRESEKRGSKKSAQIWRYADDRWKSTIDAQAFHDEYQYLEWRKPLWYSLLFILSSQKRRVNKLPVDDNLKSTADVLLGGSSPNGLFPGLLGEDQQPVVFQDERDRDSYWHATFEIPYVLWTYGKDYFHAQSTREKGHRTTPEEASAAILSSRDAGRIGQIITKTVQFANLSTLIDQKGLVEVSDDWLQTQPSALDFDFLPEFEKLGDLKCKEEDEVIGSGLRSYLEAKKDHDLIIKNERSISDTEGKKGTIIDISKESNGNEIKERRQATNVEIMSSLSKRRTVQTAKKRIVWLPTGDRETALLCYFASPGPERDNISHFFERHASHEKYFFDGAIAALNEWETEIHFSFFRLVKHSHDSMKEFFRPSETAITRTSFLKLGEAHAVKSLETVISRATMSFRFIGDFFDRFWTCHFLEHDRNVSHESLGDRLSYLSHTELKDSKKNPWQQRKVLELLLFSEMLDEMYSKTKEILDWVKDEALKPPKPKEVKCDLVQNVRVVRLLDDNSLEKSPIDASEDDRNPLNSLAEAVRGGNQLLKQGTSENYFLIIGNWRLFEQILQALEDDLGENIERINQWDRRDEDRKSERPRWTRNDEKRYRTAIAKLTILNQRRARDITHLKSTIKAFRESLPGRLESIRSDLSFRGSESINVFTYVTVVFVPLSFAIGIFSMNGLPDRSTLISMIEVALVALVITVFALANAQSTGKKIVLPILKLCWLINRFALYPVVSNAHSFLKSIFVTPVRYAMRKQKGNGENRQTDKKTQQKQADVETSGIQNGILAQIKNRTYRKKQDDVERRLPN